MGLLSSLSNEIAKVKKVKEFMPITVGNPIEIEGNVYNIKKILGKGGLSTVFLGINSKSGKKVAIKSYLYQEFYNPITRKNDCEKFFENEVLNTQAQAKSGLKCVKVLQFEKKLNLQTPEFYIVLSYIEGLTFLEFYRKFIKSCRGLAHLDLASIVRNIFIPLAELLEYCHSEEFIIHRDISVGNIIIQEGKDGDFWPILIDWGVSKYVGEEWINFPPPKPYMGDIVFRDIPIKQKGAPPEIKFGYIPTRASDIYYLAHLMYFVFTGGIMREDSEILTKKSYILDPKKINWYIPDSYNRVVKKFTQYEPVDRPKNMKEVIKSLKELIKIRQIHFDFEFILENPDTDELTGERI